MNAILRNALTAAALTVATPALAWTVWPDVDFEWYANVGRPAAGTMQEYPAPRVGFIWSPGRYEWTGTREVYMPGVWIKDDYDAQWRAYASGRTAVTFSTGPLELLDRDGNVIAINAQAYPVDSALR